MQAPHRRAARRWAGLGLAGTLLGVVALAGVHSASIGRDDVRGLVDAAAGTPEPDADSSDGRVEGDPISLDRDHLAISRLDPELLGALVRADRSADRSSIELTVTSGWRSAEYQRELLLQAIDEYGNRDEALKWVQTPRVSSHTKGEGVDIGPPEAAAWLDRAGARFGLCRIYANEDWHFELAVRPGGTCPELLEDSSVAVPDP